MQAIIYARYSSHLQREESIEDQVRVCEDAAKAAGDEVVAVYFDKAISGTTDNRPGFQAMISHAKMKKTRSWDRIWCYKTNRFARNRYSSAVYKHELKKAGVIVKYASEPIPDGPVGILMESVLEGIAEYYSAELGENVKRGHRGNALKCHPNGCTRYGYKISGAYIDDDGKFHPGDHYEIDDKEADGVLKMYRMRAEGHTYQYIEQAIYDAGYRYKNGHTIKYRAISSIIKNEIYRGVYHFGGIRIENGAPRIISDALWQDANNPRLITDNRQKRPYNHNIKGNRYGYLEPLDIADIDSNHHYKWLCKCHACGAIKVIYATVLTSGRAKDCGCQSDFIRPRNKNGTFAQVDKTVI